MRIRLIEIPALAMLGREAETRGRRAV